MDQLQIFLVGHCFSWALGFLPYVDAPVLCPDEFEVLLPFYLKALLEKIFVVWAQALVDINAIIRVSDHTEISGITSGIIASKGLYNGLQFDSTLNPMSHVVSSTACSIFWKDQAVVIYFF